MPRALTGRDMSVLTIANGGAVDGAYTYGTAVNIRCYCDSYEREASVGTLDITARCDAEEQAVPTFESARINLTLTSPAAGFLIPDSWLGQAVQTVATMVASGDTFTDALMVQSIRISSPKDGVLTQAVTLVPAYLG